MMRAHAPPQSWENTAAGDLAAEKLALGYWTSALVFAAVIAAITIAHKVFRLKAILAFWIPYILTWQLGASLGDYLSQPKDVGGLDLGTVVTSAILLTTILALVVYLAKTRRDVGTDEAGHR
jgi:uncharacterized membrane-anchored protein